MVANPEEYDDWKYWAARDRGLDFAKQIGARAQEEAMGEWGVGTFDLRLRDRAGADPSEWPEDIRVRQFPEVRRR